MLINLHFGALANPILVQLEEQNLALSNVEARVYQRIADAITLLNVNSFINDSTTQKARKKLLREIAKKTNPF